MVGFAEALLAVLAKKARGTRLAFDIEVLLRASIRAPTYTTDAYFAALAGAGQSAETANYLPEAKRLRDRSVKQLRQRITRAIREILRNTRNKEFGEIAYYVATTQTS